MIHKVHSIINSCGIDLVVDVECHLSNNLPTIVIVGFANRALGEAKERVRGAFISSKLELPRRRITINLAPADIPKDGSSFDLSIATAILVASGQSRFSFGPTHAVIGELGLQGDVRPVRGIIGKLLTARSHGVNTCFIPAANLSQGLLVPGMTLIPVASLLDLHSYLNFPAEIPYADTGNGQNTPLGQSDSQHSTLDDVAGQAFAKRALQIAAAGGHNLLLSGPPGTGKSMLAKALPSLLPPLSHEEMLEVTHLHSLAGSQYEQIVTKRPFRSPHHSSSLLAIIGGGNGMHPGEISLAHRGVLFFDELPEFSQATLESLRQPLEDEHVTIARVKHTVDYPAAFIFVGTANPCPCGYFGSNNTQKICNCPRYLIQRYQQRTSGPLLDRLDLFAPVGPVDHAQLIKPKTDQKFEQISGTVARARNIQGARFGSARLNAAMTNSDIRAYAVPTNEATTLLNNACKSLGLSGRSYMRTIKVARTIADLENCEIIDVQHVSEALQYRKQDQL